MASDTDDPEAAAGRLEAALERIAQAALRNEASQATQPALDAAALAGDHSLPEDQNSPGDHISSADTREVAARLDDLIDRLRAVLGSKAG
ncbi:MAG: hypothetical protein WDN25_12370 [Acetobacteraceae bacterium]